MRTVFGWCADGVQVMSVRLVSQLASGALRWLPERQEGSMVQHWRHERAKEVVVAGEAEPSFAADTVGDIGVLEAQDNLHTTGEAPVYCHLRDVAVLACAEMRESILAVLQAHDRSATSPADLVIVQCSVPRLVSQLAAGALRWLPERQERSMVQHWRHERCPEHGPARKECRMLALKEPRLALPSFHSARSSHRVDA